MSENMPRKPQTTAPTSRLMGRGAGFFALCLARLGGFFFAVPADFLVPPVELAIFRDSLLNYS